MLDYGDNIMAHGGFDIADILPDGVLLLNPPFKGPKLLKKLKIPLELLLTGFMLREP